jgi:phage anti-repressor protein
MRHLTEIKDVLDEWDRERRQELTMPTNQAGYLGMTNEQWQRWANDEMSAEELAELGYCEAHPERRHLEDIDDVLFARGHQPEDDDMELHEFLGMTRHQYERWSNGNMSDEELAELGYFIQ